MELNLPRLIDAIAEGWTKCLPPPYGDGEFSAAVDKQTDCNRFVNFVCEKMGIKDFQGLRANQIYDKLLSDKAWKEIIGENAIYYANKGYIVIAAWKNPDPALSGHVAIVRPGEGVTSSKWKQTKPMVPKVANVGPVERCRWDRGANFSFGEEPKYFVLTAVTNGRTGEAKSN